MDTPYIGNTRMKHIICPKLARRARLPPDFGYLCNNINVINNCFGVEFRIDRLSVDPKSPWQKSSVCWIAENQAGMLAKFFWCMRSASTDWLRLRYWQLRAKSEVAKVQRIKIV
ncbi:hypothetical protein SPM24T3_04587 [Serratia sp. M24T3]|nr:hypothetical protein SPM24T3_04587 [Serratia sp. M24T3]